MKLSDVTFRIGNRVIKPPENVDRYRLLDDLMFAVSAELMNTDEHELALIADEAKTQVMFEKSPWAVEDGFIDMRGHIQRKCDALLLSIERR